VKMYRYSLEERVFIVKTYWITGSINPFASYLNALLVAFMRPQRAICCDWVKNCQRMFVEQFGGKQALHISHDWLTMRAASSWLSLSYLIFSCYQLPFLRIPKTHNRTSLQVLHANVLHFCSFCKPTFSRATCEWDALYQTTQGLISEGNTLMIHVSYMFSRTYQCLLGACPASFVACCYRMLHRCSKVCAYMFTVCHSFNTFSAHLRFAVTTALWTSVFSCGMC
jgi:hypothetical protein